MIPELLQNQGPLSSCTWTSAHPDLCAFRSHLWLQLSHLGVFTAFSTASGILQFQECPCDPHRSPAFPFFWDFTFLLRPSGTNPLIPKQGHPNSPGKFPFSGDVLAQEGCGIFGIRAECDPTQGLSLVWDAGRNSQDREGTKPP